MLFYLPNVAVYDFKLNISQRKDLRKNLNETKKNANTCCCVGTDFNVKKKQKHYTQRSRHRGNIVKLHTAIR
jgi:hypothetical protein